MLVPVSEAARLWVRVLRKWIDLAEVGRDIVGFNQMLQARQHQWNEVPRPRLRLSNPVGRRHLGFKCPGLPEATLPGDSAGWFRGAPGRARVEL